MVQTFGIFLLAWVSMSSYLAEDGNLIPSVSPEKVYEAILEIISDSQYSNNIYEEAWDMFGTMAWESFADEQGLGSESIHKVPFNPIAYSTRPSGTTLAVGALQLNVEHFADWIMEDMQRRGYADKMTSYNAFNTKKSYWKADDPNLDIKKKNFAQAKEWLMNKDNRAAILAWTSDPATWDKQVEIAKQSFTDQERQGRYGAIGWEAYTDGGMEKGWEVLEKEFGFTRVNQLDLHQLANEDSIPNDSTMMKEVSLVEGVYNRF